LNRIDKLRKKLDDLGVDIYLETDLSNIRYLTGFTGSHAFLLVGKDLTLFVSDGRYREQSKEEVKDADIFIYSKKVFEFKEKLPELKLKIGIPKHNITCGLFEALKYELEGFEFVLVDDPVITMRMIKSEDEIEKIRKSQEVTDRVFDELLKRIEPGKMTELDLAAEIEYLMKKFGAEKPSFDTIVATGPHSALPHAKPRRVTVESGTNLLVDMGNYVDGYSSDMTRTVWIGDNPPDEFVKIYNIKLRYCQATVGPHYDLSYLKVPCYVEWKWHILDNLRTFTSICSALSTL